VVGLICIEGPSTRTRRSVRLHQHQGPRLPTPGRPVIYVDTKKKELVASSRTLAGSGARPGRRRGSRSTTSPTPQLGRPSHTATTTWAANTGSRSTSTTTPQRSRSPRSAPGGTATEPPPTRK